MAIEANKSAQSTLQDIVNGFMLWRYWLFRSWVKYQLKFRPTFLGMLWPIISLSIVVLILGTVWGVILAKTDSFNYYLYLGVGFPVWQAISGSVDQGNLGFTSAQTNSGLPFSAIIFERLSVIFISFINVMPLVFILVVCLGSFEIISIFWVFWSLCCLLAWSAGVVLLVSVAVTLKPDLSQLINALMKLAFLATPIIWEPSRLGEYQKYLWLNPFYAPLEFTRSSFSGADQINNIVPIATIYSFSILIIGLTILFIFFSKVKLKASQ